ncbi:conserved unknown protein [Ectocarpus siliculosus]|uniref:Spore protein YkvP/CgeB glycosyl transferase-like domain-containing protein n=1 Tax=Ectocarpus siliculosus TaxID=2880 RepID=D7FUL1_ECTSI|nr:conserved unknown protein [Ectocarpus siliculosus]|eukprot:CBJ31667.1 conserved unknown protein [Ectocarpus siliculosus]
MWCGVIFVLLAYTGAAAAAAVTKAATGGEGVNVALHAQSNYAVHGWVAGSEITTSGLRRAFAALPCVRSCEIFAPFSYDGVSSRKWDLVIIEGYTGSVPAFIHEVRAGNDDVVVLFYCLDTYPSLSVVGNLDVDAFLTNSLALLPFLRQIAPASSLVHLAADPSVMQAAPFRPEYAHNVVYLGQFKGTKHRLVETLKEVAPYGLAIYGNGWSGVEGAEELLPFWRGILPLGDVAALYTSAKVVIATTETLQRSLGMVNNRVFEALSCGTAVVSDAFPAAEEMFGDHVHFYRQPGDAARAVKHLLGNDTARTDLGRRGRELVLSKHTFASRVVTILSSVDEVVALKNQEEASAAGEASSAAARRLAPPPGEATAAATAGGDDTPARGAAGADAIAAAVGATAVPKGGGGVESCCQSGRACRNAVEFTACPTPTTAPGEGGEILATSVTSCPPEGTPPGEEGAAVEEVRPRSRRHHDPLPPSPPLRAAAPVRAHQRPGQAQPLAHGAGEHATGSGDISSDDATQATSCDGSGDNSTSRRSCNGSRDDTTSGACRHGSSDSSTTGTPCNGGSGDDTKRATSRNGSGNPDCPMPQLLGRKKTPLVVRPNAPLVLVVYRSETPPPGQLRRDLQSAAGAVAGGARIAFMETTAETLGGRDSDVECSGWGRRIGAEEFSRLKALQTRVSRLLADAGPAAAHGEHGDTPNVDFLGVEAAREAHGFMEWCCSVSMLIVYSNVGDPLERWFLHRLVGEHASRVVRTAFLAVAAGGSEGAEEQHSVARQEHEIARQRHGVAGQHGKAPTSLEAQRLDRYEWVEHLGGCGEGRSCPGSVPSEGGCFAEETRGKTCPSVSRLKNKIEQTLFRVSRHATISMLEPREGTVFAAERSEREGAGDWAQLRLRVKVVHPYFRTPDDGMWCVLLEDVEVGCRGDYDSRERGGYSHAVTVEIDPVVLPRRCRLQVVTKGGGVETPRVLNKSPPISVTIW